MCNYAVKSASPDFGMDLQVSLIVVIQVVPTVLHFPLSATLYHYTNGTHYYFIYY